MLDLSSYYSVVSGERRGFAASFARGLLRVVSWGYASGVAVRNALYESGVLPQHVAGVPVVSVGNLTLGGTGKTPFVELLCRWFLDRGKRPVILSRGYAAQGPRNDEALVLQANLPDVPHLQHRDRVALARRACSELRPDVLVLDDGFQHRRLARDLDIVLVDCTAPFGYGKLFPRGLLREPLASLRRADLIALTRADAVCDDTRARIRQTVARSSGSTPMLETVFRPTGLCGHDGATRDLAHLHGRRVVAFCGIGNPEGFRQTMRGLDCTPADVRTFPDHYHYQESDIRALHDWARQHRADLVLTTQKDLVKIPPVQWGDCPLLALRIQTRVTSGSDWLEERLVRLLPATARRA